MKKVLMTGATGKIGSQLVPRLAAYDDTAVRAFVRSADKTAPLSAAGAELALGTFEDAQAVRAAVDGIDTLVLSRSKTPTPPTRRVYVRLCALRLQGSH